MKPHWEHFEHGADIGIRGLGSTPAEAFEQIALAMTAAITSPDRIQDRDSVQIRIRAPNLDYLLLDWLNALVFEMATRRMLFGRFAVNLQGRSLDARAFGEPIDRERHQPVVEIKGATLTTLEVRELDSGDWLAQCVIDV